MAARAVAVQHRISSIAITVDLKFLIGNDSYQTNFITKIPAKNAQIVAWPKVMKYLRCPDPGSILSSSLFNPPISAIIQQAKQKTLCIRKLPEAIDVEM
ncbi:hypothetical protein N9Y91_09510 [Alphaproteobacteria bacterium]|nr:hypothetical protein [Alphaproteobacteria bacterium]